MKKSNTDNWHDFTFKELGFKNYHGTRIKKADREDGNIPLLTAGYINNGVVGYIGNAKNTYTNAITIDMFGNCFYHKGEYAGDDNIYFFINDSISENCKLFIVSSLQNTLKNKFSFVDQFRQDNADDVKVKLPIKNGVPDWDHMEKYINKVINKQKERLKTLLNESKINKTLIDSKNWENFYIKDFCELEKNKNQVPTGSNIKRAELIEGETPRVSVSGINNGIIGFFKSDSKKFNKYANFISVSFLGGVFYQEKETSLDMKVHCVKPKKIELNRYTGLFLATAIKQSLYKYAYSDQISSSLLPNIAVKLPSKNDEPDWEYMEEYMMNVENQCNGKMKLINTKFIN